jgi:hypothetical protein
MTYPNLPSPAKNHCALQLRVPGQALVACLSLSYISLLTLPSPPPPLPPCYTFQCDHLEGNLWMGLLSRHKGYRCMEVGAESLSRINEARDDVSLQDEKMASHEKISE